MGIVVTPGFKKRLSKKSPEQVGPVLRCIKRLEVNPRHPGLHTHRVQGTRDVWEAYVDDGNRVTFHYASGDIVMRNHCNHEILRRP